jgi:hypothetical protein
MVEKMELESIFLDFQSKVIPLYDFSIKTKSPLEILRPLRG